MKLKNNDLIKIEGGTTTSYTSASFISAITRSLNLILDLGRSIGTAFNRIINNKKC